MNTVVITGANRGIGLELSRQLAKRGDKVVALCRRSSAALDALDVKVIEGIDVTSDDLKNVLSDKISDIDIDILINNAGILQMESINDLDFESIRRQFEVNALGPLKVCAALRSRMKQPSKMIFITSRMGSIEDNTSGGMYGYRASKCALNMLATSLALDLARDQVSIGIFHPGFVRTEMTRGNGNVEASEAAADLVKRLDGLSLESSGQFLHANGETLPW
jgi:NAD(P)-dependent dehydrogenase (short-subunit alcohol dehydrogenase family)